MSAFLEPYRPSLVEPHPCPDCGARRLDDREHPRCRHCRTRVCVDCCAEDSYREASYTVLCSACEREVSAFQFLVQEGMLP